MSEYFVNPHPAYCGQTIAIPRDACAKALGVCVHDIEATPHGVTSAGNPVTDGGIYTGVGGRVYYNYLMFTKTAKKQYLDRAAKLLPVVLAWADTHCDSSSKAKPSVGFYGGAPGVYAVAACVLSVQGQDPTPYLTRLMKSPSFRDTVLNRNHPECWDEVLFGRAGYLQAILVACQGTSTPIMTYKDYIRSIVDVIIQRSTPHAIYGATWSWRGKDYLGTAHGTVGILHQMLCVWECLTLAQQAFVVGAVNSIMAVTVSEKGLPNKADSLPTDLRLVHFCHGVPGVIFLLAKASEVILDQEREFLRAAQFLTEAIVWPCGLLRKGTGLCHGSAGTAYCFLTMYRRTHDHRYLYYAVKFGDVMMDSRAYRESCASYVDPQREVQGMADRPTSLMEGSAGTALFWQDLMYPEGSFFPGFEMPSRPAGFVVNPSHRLLLEDRVWATTVMEPSLCEELMKYVATIPGDEAIIVNQRFHRVINVLLGMTQRFAEEVMLPCDPKRLYETLPCEERPLELMSERMKTLSSLDVSKRKKTSPKSTRTVPPMFQLSVVRAHVVRFNHTTHPCVQPHCDGADITLNVCLHRTCNEGELVFDGPDHVTFYRHVVGEATLFWGNVVHHTHPGVKGDRVQLVLLMRFLRPSECDQVDRPLNFMALSTDVRLHILSYCGLRTIAYVGYLCRALAVETGASILWRGLYLNNKELQDFMSVAELEGRDEKGLCGTLEEEEDQGEKKKKPAYIRNPVNRARQEARVKVVNNGPDHWKATYLSSKQALRGFKEEMRYYDAEFESDLYDQGTGSTGDHTLYYRHHVVFEGCTARNVGSCLACRNTYDPDSSLEPEAEETDVDFVTPWPRRRRFR